MSVQSHKVTIDEAGTTVAARLRTLFPDQSWNQVRRIIQSGRVRIDEQVCRDSGRRVKTDETIEVLKRGFPPNREAEKVKIRHLDKHLVIVEKPAGINTVRHPMERMWSRRRKALSPSLEDIVAGLISKAERNLRKPGRERLRVVHRLDKETSGLVVFTRSVSAERALGKQFHAHTVLRRYLALVPGRLRPQRVASFLVRDRGDGRRGSTRLPGQGKEAITHIEVEEELSRYTLISCRLETGRTHQIRIHLAELGNPVCGERVYNRKTNGEIWLDRSGAPRLALHAIELGFVHPASGETMHWSMPLPADLKEFLDRIRSKTAHQK
jgi:23S rRNA pseudouridine1911/1915/1917 synthase